MPESSYKVNIIVSATDKMSGPLTDAAKKLDALGQAAKNLRLAESIGKSADLAEAAMGKLGESFARGEINIGQYGQAVESIQKSFGMVSPASAKATQKMLELDRAFAKGEISAEQYATELKQVSQTLDQTGGKAKTAGGVIQGVMQGIGQSIGMMAMNAAQQIPRVAVELIKTGAAAERQGVALDNLAAAAGTSGDAIIKSIQEASMFTIDRMAAMQTANRAMVLDVANSPEAFERLTKVATALGRAMGRDAVTSIDDFVTAAGRQSKLIADNLGLMVDAETANTNYAAALGKTADELTDAERKQAFLNEMLRQGEAKMSELGDQVLDNAGKIEQSSAAWKDIKTAMGGILLNAAELTGALDTMATRTTTMAGALETLNENGFSFKAWLASIAAFGQGPAAQLEAYNKVIEQQAEQYAHASEEIERYAHTLEQSAEVGRYITTEAKEQGQTFDDLSYASRRVIDAAHDQVQSGGDILHTILQTADVIRSDGITSQEELERTILGVTDTIRDEERAVYDIAGAIETAAGRLDQAMRYADVEKDTAESAQDYADKRAEIEREHQEKLEKLRKQGASSAVKVDEAAEQEKLVDLQRKLEIALQQQSEFTDKTKASTLMSKEDQIARLREQIGEQTQLLDNYHAGRLVKTGQNVSGLIAEEERHYQESVAKLEAAQAEQEAAQKQSLGRMVLAHFDAWAEMNLATDGYTQQEKQFIIDSRASIAEEYGLVTKTAIEEMEKQEKEWARTMAIMTGEATGFFDYFMQEWNALPSEKTLLIREELASRPVDVPKKQHGGPVYAGQPYLVGEAGPELFVPARAGTIVDSHDTYQFYTQAAAATVMTGKRRAHLGRMMN